MTRHGTMRHGCLQFYPRVRAKKFLPRVSWNSLSREGVNFLGFIGYKVGMKSAFVKDNTPNSLTKGQRVIIPVTIIECPTMKIFSVRFYKNNKVVGEVLNSNLDKELKKKLKLPKKINKKIEDFKEGDFDDIRAIVYSQVKKTGIKKSPDIVELGLSGDANEKLEFVKNNLPKEISVIDVMKEKLKEGILDIHAVTKGKGLQGIVKRFGLKLKFHKSEKGQRTHGSGGPWHPARVDFTQPMSGQMGFFTRVINNNKIIDINNIKEKDINPPEGFKHFGKIRTDYVLIYGSIPGASKRSLLMTVPMRASKGQFKKNYELIELR